MKHSLLVLSLMHEATEAAATTLQAKIEADLLLAARGDETAKARASENLDRLEQRIGELGAIESLILGKARPCPEAP
jgi:hypothetical protein